jgi:DNA phosphorothioation-dependent restriction protein DptH
LMATQQALRNQFDPDYQQPDRVDRQIKVRELSVLLFFYLERSRRYGLVSDEAFQQLDQFIQTLDSGYKVNYSSVGVIFDFGTSGLVKDEEHAGLTFYRIGRDYIERMISHGMRRQSLVEEINEAQESSERRREIIDTTDMRDDAKYPEVRTGFRTPTWKKSAQVGTEVESDQPKLPPPLVKKEDLPIQPAQSSEKPCNDIHSEPQRPAEISVSPTSISSDQAVRANREGCRKVPGIGFEWCQHDQPVWCTGWWKILHSWNGGGDGNTAAP